MILLYSVWITIAIFGSEVSSQRDSKDIEGLFLDLLRNIADTNEKRINALSNVDKDHDFRNSYLSNVYEVVEDTDEQTDNIEDINMFSRNPIFEFHNKQLRSTMPKTRVPNSPFKRKSNGIKKVHQNQDFISAIPKKYQFISDLDLIQQMKNTYSKDKENKNIQYNEDNIGKYYKYLNNSEVTANITDIKLNSGKNKSLINSASKQNNNSLVLSKAIEKPIHDVPEKLDDGHKQFNEENILGNKSLGVPTIYKEVLRTRWCKERKRKRRCDEDDDDTPSCYEKCVNFCGKNYGTKNKRRPKYKGEETEIWDEIKNNDAFKGNSSHIIASGGKENGALRKNGRRSGWRGALDRKAIKACKNACCRAHKTVCKWFKCSGRAKDAFKRECASSCKNEFTGSYYSDED